MPAHPGGGVITAQWVRRKLTLRGVLTTVTKSDDRDDMNRPTETITTKTIRFLMHPKQADETNDPQQVGKRLMTGYFDACDTIDTTSRLTYAGLEFEFIGPPEPWPSPRTGEIVGQTATLARTQ